MSETSDITTPLVRALNRIPGCMARRQHAGRVRVRGGWLVLGDKGWPDIAAVVSGTPLFIETKTEDGRLSTEQKECHERLRRVGAVVHVCRSVGEGVKAARGLLGGTR